MICTGETGMKKAMLERILYTAVLVLGCMEGEWIGGILVLVRGVMIFAEIIKKIKGYFWTQCPKMKLETG